MILAPGPLDPPAGRLLAALASAGAEVASDARRLPDAGSVTIAVSTGPSGTDFAELVRGAKGRPVRALVLSRLGAHPDARDPALQRLWQLEEQVRGARLPTLTLRFGPLLGPGTPLWSKLRTRPALPRGGRQLINPVSERDVLETLRRALDGRAAWEGWFEVAGPEAWTLAELRELAASAGRGPEPGEWEPSLAELEEHRLAESGPWMKHFGLSPERLVDAVREVVA